eukprot:s1940_g2.t2
MGRSHRFHQKNTTMGVLSEDARIFTKRSNKGRLSIVCENKVHFQGTVRYAVQFTDGELCSADGVGFIISSDVPCTKNIQKIVSVFANRTGRICIRVHDEVVRCPERVKCLEVGDWLEVFSDLTQQTVSFTVWPKDGSEPSFATVSFKETLAQARARGVNGLPRSVCGYLAVVIKHLGVLLDLGRYASATARRRQIKKAQVVDTKPVAKPEPIKTEESPKQTQVVVPSKPERKSWADVASDDEDMTDFAWTTQEALLSLSWSTAATDSLDELVPVGPSAHAPAWVVHMMGLSLLRPGAKQTPENYLTEQQEQLRQQELLAEQMRQIQLVQMRQEQMRQEQMRQEQLHQEQLRQEQLRKEQLRQKQLRQEQMRQEQMRQEQVRQEQLRQEQLRQEQLQLERLQQQKQQQQQQAQMQMQQLQLQMQQVQGQMQTQGQAQQAMLVAVPMNFMPMMMPSQLAFTCVDAALLIGIADAPRNQMQTAPQHALGYPEDEEQQQQQQAKAIVPLPKYAEGPTFGSTHRFHQKNSSMGVLSQDARTFTKSSNKGRLSIICENRVHFSGVSRYAVQFTEGELCSADGVGFILSSDLPCTKNIQRIVSVFANRTGRICVRVHEEVERCSQRVKCLEVGDWLEVISDLDNQTVSFVALAVVRSMAAQNGQSQAVTQVEASARMGLAGAEVFRPTSRSRLLPQQAGAGDEACQGWIDVLIRSEFGSIIVGGCYICFVANFLFFGLTYAMPQVFRVMQSPFHPATQVLVVTSADIPACLLSSILIRSKAYGHRDSLSALAIVLAMLLPTLIILELGDVGIVSAAIYASYLAKCAVTAFFTIAYVYVTEIFPSAYRCTAASTCMAGGRIGSVLAPLAFELLTSGGESHIPFWLLCSLLCVIAVWVIQRCLTFELKGEPLEDVVLKGGGNLKLKRPSLLTPPENKADKMRTGHRGRHTASAQEFWIQTLRGTLMPSFTASTVGRTTTLKTQSGRGCSCCFCWKGMANNRHTILLVQFDDSKDARTYIDYPGIREAMDGVCQLYEQSLKAMNPQLRSTTYDVKDLYSFIDTVQDLSCLVFNPRAGSYVPHNKDWIKVEVFNHLKSQVQQ